MESDNGHRSSVGRASAQQIEGLGSNPNKCHIFFIGRSNFNKGLQNLIMLIKNDKRIIKIKLLYIYIKSKPLDVVQSLHFGSKLPS